MPSVKLLIVMWLQYIELLIIMWLQYIELLIIMWLQYIELPIIMWLQVHRITYHVIQYIIMWLAPPTVIMIWGTHFWCIAHWIFVPHSGGEGSLLRKGVCTVGSGAVWTTHWNGIVTSLNQQFSLLTTHPQILFCFSLHPLHTLRFAKWQLMVDVVGMPSKTYLLLV